MANAKPAVAVIGGGFSGAAVAVRLLGLADHAVHVVESRPRLAFGLTYGDARDYHVLNVPAGRMSFWQDRPDHFLDWARQHGARLGWPEAAAAQPGTYLQRRLYGHYAAEVVEAASAGRPLTHHQTQAVALERTEAGYRVALADGSRIEAAAVIVATGHNAPIPAWPVHGQGVAYTDNPWTDAATAELDPEAAVLLIGTGLTMVDVIYRLHREGHRGPITALSRHGLLPRPRGEASPAAPAVIAAEGARGIRHVFDALRRASTRASGDWRAVIDGLRPVTNDLWQALSLAEKQRFLRHPRSFWEVHRHRMPAESVALLAGLSQTGQLSVTAGRVEAIHVGANAATVSWHRRGSRQTEQVEVARVINCTPGQSDIGQAADPFLADARDKGLLRPDPLGLGLDTGEDGILIGADGAPVPGLFTLGPLLRGRLLEVTAVPDIRLQADALAPVVAAWVGRAASNALKC